MNYDVESILNLQLKKQLYEKAVNLNIKGRAHLGKSALSNRIARILLTEEWMSRYLIELDDHQYRLFCESVRHPVLLKDSEASIAGMIQDAGYGYIYKTSFFTISEEVKSLYYKLEIEEIEKSRNKLRWLRKCMYFCVDLYGFVPDDILLNAFNTRRQYHFSVKELIELYENHRLLFEEYRYYEGIFVKGDVPIIQMMKLLGKQNGCDFYIPTIKEIEDYYCNQYLSSNSAYSRFYEFLLEKLHLSPDDSKNILRNLWKVNSKGDDLVKELGHYIELIEFDSSDDIMSMIRYATDAYNNTRSQYYRGYTPIEMKRKLSHSNGSVLLLGRSEEIGMLKALLPILNQKGYEIKISENKASGMGKVKRDSTLISKVYPNDPCPCGSGRKFKKCCGKVKN